MSASPKSRRCDRECISREQKHFRYRTISNGQLEEILTISKNDPSLRDLHDVVRVISNTGLRKGELQELRWSDVDLQNRRFILHPHKSSSLRYVPFGAKTAQTLIARCNAERDSVFVLGKSPSAILKRVARQLRTNFTKPREHTVTLHSLRHTFFTRLSASGASILSMATIGGWRLDRFGLKFLLTPEQSNNSAALAQDRLEAEE